MKINVSSKTVSVGISFLVFLAIGILAVALIGKGKPEENISFDIYSDIVYSEHEGWTDVSEKSEDEVFSEESSSEETVVLDADEIMSTVNSEYNCSGNPTDNIFSDETGINIQKISFLNNYTPENVSVSLGYIFAGDKVFDLHGNDLTELVSEYEFVGGRDKNGHALFEKLGEYYYLENGIFSKAENISNINKGPAYLSVLDENYPLFEENGYWGAKDKNGEVVVKAMYTYGYGFNEGVGCFASKSKKLYFYNTSGKLISSEFVVPESGFGSLRIQNGITLVSNGKKNAIMKASGAILETPDDYNVLGCSDGMILLEKKGKMGFMNQNGAWVTNPSFVSASLYSEGLAVVSENGCFVIDTSGEIVIPKGFDFVSEFTDGRSIMYSNKSGWYMATKHFIE